LATEITDIGDARLGIMERKLDAFLAETFGPDSDEHKRYLFDFTCLRPTSWYAGITPQEIATAIRKKPQNAKTQLEAMKSGLEEELAGADQTSSGKTQ
jgi:hypothetical protein